MNNLFKGSNGKFVMNLFKSLGVICAVVAVNSCTKDPKNDNSNNNDAAKKILGELKRKSKIVAGKENEVLAEIEKLKKAGKSDEDIIKEIEESDFLEKEASTKNTPASKSQSKNQGNNEKTFSEKVGECSDLGSFKKLISDKDVDKTNSDNVKAVNGWSEKKFGGKEVVLSVNCKIFGLDVKGPGEVNQILDILIILDKEWGKKDLKLKIEDGKTWGLLINNKKVEVDKGIEYFNVGGSLGKDIAFEDFDNNKVKISGEDFELDSLDEMFKMINFVGEVNDGKFFNKGDVVVDSGSVGCIVFLGKSIKVVDDDVDVVKKGIDILEKCKSCKVVGKFLDGNQIVGNTLTTDIKSDDEINFVLRVDFNAGGKNSKKVFVGGDFNYNDKFMEILGWEVEDSSGAAGGKTKYRKGAISGVHFVK